MRFQRTINRSKRPSRYGESSTGTLAIVFARFDEISHELQTANSKTKKNIVVSKFLVARSKRPHSDSSFASTCGLILQCCSQVVLVMSQWSPVHKFQTRTWTRNHEHPSSEGTSSPAGVFITANWNRKACSKFIGEIPYIYPFLCYFFSNVASKGYIMQ